MRVQLFTGKGGVGKTTLAAATAVHLAGLGRKVLVVSTDPAHSLADALGQPLTDRPTELDTGLAGVQLATRRLLEDRWAEVTAALGDVLGPDSGLADVATDELTVLPGVEELLALGEVRRLVEAGVWDTLVLDCGPTAETVRMLALPEAVSGYLEQAWPRHRRIVHGALGRQGARVARLADALERVDESARGLRTLLSDPATTSVRLVLTPERVVLAETRRTLTSLALHGLRVDGVVANRVLPDVPGAPGAPEHPGLAWLATRVGEQREVLARLAAELPAELALTTVEHRAAEPVGLEALAELGRHLAADTEPVAPGSTGPTVTLESGSGLDSVYLWRLALPLAHDAGVELSRVGDDLLVGAVGLRRRLSLPPVLRRCTVTDAEVSAGSLLVRFTPDETLWMR
ncbi:ArsA family ATPase [Rhodococcus aerolatus]